MKCRCGIEYEREVTAKIKGKTYKILSCSRCGDRAYEITKENKDLWKKVFDEKS